MELLDQRPLFKFVTVIVNIRVTMIAPLGAGNVFFLQVIDLKMLTSFHDSYVFLYILE